MFQRGGFNLEDLKGDFQKQLDDVMVTMAVFYSS